MKLFWSLFLHKRCEKHKKQNARSKHKPLITAFACHETLSAKEFE